MIDIKSQMYRKAGLGSLFVKSYMENKDFDFYKELYERHQFIMGGYEGYKKTPQDFSDSFIKLIESFKKKGFDKNYPITVSIEGVPIDGHHRVACCIYFNIIPEYIIDNSVSIKHYNGLSWLLKNKIIQKCFNQYEKIIIIREYAKYNSIYLYDSIPNAKKNFGKYVFIYKQNKKSIYITNEARSGLSESPLTKELLSEPQSQGNFGTDLIHIKEPLCYISNKINRCKRKLFEYILKIIT